MRKKSTIAFLLAVCLVLFPKSANAADYLSEDFETISSGVPSGWDVAGSTTTNANYLWRSTAKGYSGTRGLRCNVGANPFGNTNLVKTPQIALQTPAELELVVKNPLGASFGILVYKADNSVDTIAPLRKEKTPDWEVRVCQLNYVGQTIRIGFLAVSLGQAAGDSYVYIDAVKVKDPPTCAIPTGLFVEEIKQTTAMLGWTLSDQGDYTDYFNLNLLKVGDVSDSSVCAEMPFSSPDYMYRLSGLEPASRYRLSLQSDCSAARRGKSQWTDDLYFTTLAAAEPVPFFFNFDNVATATPLGWSVSGDNTVGISTSYKYSSAGKSLMLAATDKAQAFVASPQILHPANDLQITFMMLSMVESPFVVGVMSDASSASSFLEIYRDTLAEAGKWTEVRCGTSAFALSDSNYHVAVIIPQGASRTVYIDNLHISAIPSCVRPERLQSADITSDGATLSWSEPGSPQGWQIRLSDGVSSRILAAGSNPFAADSLKGQTDYTFSVRSVCSVGDTSEWSLPHLFTTGCAVLDGPVFSMGFESDEERSLQCWDIVTFKPDAGNNFPWQAKSGSMNAHSGYYSMGKSPSRVQNARSLLISQPFSVDQADKYMVRYWMRRVAGQLYPYPDEGLRLWINNRPDTVGADKYDFIPVNGSFAPKVETTGFYQYDALIARTGEVYLIFEGVTQNGQAVIIDDISVAEAPECLKVQRLAVGEVSGGALPISWTQVVGQAEWAVRYDLYDGSAHTTGFAVVTEPRCTIPGLHAATSYTLNCSVATVCGADTSEWVEVKDHRFVSECLPYTNFPLIESFEGEAFPPPCWVRRQSVAGVTATSAPDYGDEAWVLSAADPNVAPPDGAGCARLRLSRRGTHTLLISPLLDIPSDGRTYAVSYHQYRNSMATSDEGVKVWINSTPDTVGGHRISYIEDGLEFDPAAPQAGFHKYEFDLPGTRRGRQYIIFEGMSQYGSDSYIDDVRVFLVPACREIELFHLGTVGAESVEVFADEPGLADGSWQVEYGDAGYTPGNGTAIFGSAAGRITIQGLQPEHLYDIYIRRYCSSEEQSVWRRVGQARTKCMPLAVSVSEPFVETFDNYVEGDAIEGCYVQLSPQTQLVPLRAFATDGYLPGCDASVSAIIGYGREIWIMRALRLSSAARYEMSAMFGQNTPSGNCYSPYATKGSMAVLPLDDLSAVTEETLLDADFDITCGWNLHKAYFSVPTDGVYYAAWKIQTNYTPERAGIDNLQVREVSCIPPSSSEVRGITDSTAQVSVSVNADSCEILVSNVPFSASGIAAANPVFNGFVSVGAGQTFNITGLSPNQPYYYSVRSICGGIRSDWAAVSSFRTRCGGAEPPYSESFEDAGVLNCWTAYENGMHFRCEVQSSEHRTGASSLRATSAQIFSPRFAVGEMGGFQLNGWVMADEDSATFEVGVTSAPECPECYYGMGTVFVPRKFTWQEFTIYFNAMDDPGFEGDANSNYVGFSFADNTGFYIDDLEFEAVPTCPKPSLPRISNVTSSSFDISCGTGGGETSWVVRVSDQYGAEVLSEEVSSNPATVSGLAPATAYSISIASVCGAADTSRYAEAGLVVTKCAAITSYPYSEDFNHETFPPLCWSQRQTVAGTGSGGNNYGDRAWVRNVSPYYTLGDAGSAMLQDSKAGTHTILVLPQFMFRAEKNYMLTYYQWRNSSRHAGEGVKVWAGASPDTVGAVRLSYVVNGKTNPPALESDGWSKIQVLIPRGVSGGQYIIFEGVSGYDKPSYIDGVTVEEMGSCIRPQDVVADSVTATTITATIVDSDPGHSAWEYICVAAGSDPAGAAPQASMSKTFVVSGLTAMREYDIYVRAVCDDEVSDWTPLRYVSTACGVTTAPYFENFERHTNTTLAVSCLDFISAAPTPSSGSFVTASGYPRAEVTTDARYTCEGRQGLKLTSSAADYLYVVLPEFAEPLATLSVSFRYVNERLTDKCSRLAVGVLSDASDPSSFELVEELPLTTAMLEREVDFVTAAASGGRIAFRYGRLANNYYAGLDSIVVSATAGCPRARGSLISVATDSAVFSLVSLADSLQAAWGDAGLAPDECASFATAVPGDLHIGGLSPATAYALHVRAICPDGEGEWTSIPFTTDCETIRITAGSPYIENFDSYESLPVPFPPCFTRVADNLEGGARYPLLTAADHLSGTRALQMKGVCAVALPRFDLPANQMIISFLPIVKYGSRLGIGVQTDLADHSDYREVYSDYFTPSASGRVVVDLSGCAATGEYIVFRLDVTSADIVIDDLRIEAAPACFAPRNLRVPFTGISDTGARATFELPASATAVEYILASSADTLRGTSSASVSGLVCPSLEPATNYSLRIRTFCAEGGVRDTSDWTAAVNFRTTETPIVMPYECGFEDNEENARWVLANGSAANQFVIGSDQAAVASGGNALYISSDGSTYAYNNHYMSIVYAYRAMRVAPGLYSFSYDWKSEGYGSSLPMDYARCFVTDDPASLQAGNQVMAPVVMDFPWPVDGGALYGEPQWRRRETTFSVEAEATLYFCIGWRNTSYSESPSRPVAVDNVRIYKIECLPLTDVAVVAAAGTSAQVEFVNPQADSVAYVVTRSADSRDNAVAADTVPVSEGRNVVEIPGLSPLTSYSLHLVALCGGTPSPQWTTIPLTTSCDNIALDTVWREDFESYIQPGASQLTSQSVGCWENIKDAGQPDAPAWQVSANEITTGPYSIYPHSGAGYAMYRYSTTARLQRTFDIEVSRPTFFEVSLFAANSNSSAMRLQIYVLHNGEETTIFDDRFSNTVYQPVVARFLAEESGAYTIGFRGENNQPSCYYLMVDDIEVRRIKHHTPSSVAVDNIAEQTARVVWGAVAEAVAYQVQVLNAETGGTLLDRTLAQPASECQVSGLEANTAYRARVRGISADSDSSDWVACGFRTPCVALQTVPVTYNFNYLSSHEVPACWSRVVGRPQSGAVNSDGNWEAYDRGGNNMAMRARQSYVAGLSALRTPVFTIASGGYRMSFDYISNYDARPLTVTVSRDGGSSFADTLLVAESDSRWTEALFDLAPYAGGQIVVEFAVDGDMAGSGYFAAIDNFSIFCMDDAVEVFDTVCPGHAYNGHDFNIAASQIPAAGGYTFTKLFRPSAPGECAYDKVLHLSVLPGSTTYLFDTICNGEYYNKGAYLGDSLSRTGAYPITLTNSSGCDSTVVLYLEVEDINIVIDTAICEGESVMLGGIERTATGIYHSYSSNSRGCDVVTTLNLYVAPRLYEKSVYVCEGASYAWGDTALATSGSYLRRFTNRYGCDSVETLHLTVLPAVTHLADTICRGGSLLHGNHQLTRPGADTLHLYNILGCDSLSIMTLSVRDIDTVRIEDSVCEGEPYFGNTFNGEVLRSDTLFFINGRTIDGQCDSVTCVAIRLLPAERRDSAVVIGPDGMVEIGGSTITQAGVLVDTIYGGAGNGCDLITTYTVTVGVGNVAIRPLTITPNPALPDALVDICHSIPAAECGDALIEIANALGQVVYSVRTTLLPSGISLRAPAVEGVYLVRITLSSGEVHLGKLVVR